MSDRLFSYGRMIGEGRAWSSNLGRWAAYQRAVDSDDPSGVVALPVGSLGNSNSVLFLTI